jgi:hypothetical protein
MHGPNAKKLIATKISRDAVPNGGGIQDAIAFLGSPECVKQGIARATKWVTLAIQAVREAAEPNPYKTADDETIAGVILKGIEAKKGSRRDATQAAAKA